MAEYGGGGKRVDLRRDEGRAWQPSQCSCFLQEDCEGCHRAAHHIARDINATYVEPSRFISSINIVTSLSTSSCDAIDPAASREV